MSEPIVITGRTEFDDYGNAIENKKRRRIDGCVVEPNGDADSWERDVFGGNAKSLRVFAPAGTVINEGDNVDIRGTRYRVSVIPWDYSYRRSPWASFHQPKVVFICEYEEA